MDSKNKMKGFTEAYKKGFSSQSEDLANRLEKMVELFAGNKEPAPVEPAPERQAMPVKPAQPAPIEPSNALEILERMSPKPQAPAQIPPIQFNKLREQFKPGDTGTTPSGVKFRVLPDGRKEVIE